MSKFAYLKNRADEFERINERLRNKKATIQEVDYFWNTAIGYKTDMQMHGKADYWQTPRETLISGYGDCEDIAIAKFFMLINYFDAYLVYCAVDGSNKKHMTCIVRERYWLFFKRDRNLDIQHRRIIEEFRFNKKDVYFPDYKNPICEARSITLWADLLVRFYKEERGLNALILQNLKA